MREEPDSTGHPELVLELDRCTTVSEILDLVARYVLQSGYPDGAVAWDTPPAVISPDPDVRVWGTLDEAMVVGRMLQPSGFEPTRPFELGDRFREQGVIGIGEIADFHAARLRVDRDVVLDFIEGLGVPDGLGLWVETGLDRGVLVCLLGDRRGCFGDADRSWLRGLMSPLRAAARRVAEAGTSPDVLRGLSPRELHVADLLAQAKTNDEIASLLFVSVYTVKKHISRSLEKTGLANRTALALAAASRHAGPVSGAVFRDVPRSTANALGQAIVAQNWVPPIDGSGEANRGA